MRRQEVIGGAGVRLHVREWGDPSAPAILFVHGWSQHHLSWAKQTASDLASLFRLVAFDLRGHGASDKPGDAASYTTSRLWAEDIRALIETLDLRAPVLVGWSMGVQVVCDYLRAFGDRMIAGMSFVGGSVCTGTDREMIDAGKIKHAATGIGMTSTDEPTTVSATVDFLKSCTAAPLSKRDLATMTGFNMLCPAAVRRHMLTRDEDYRPDLNRVTKPCLITYGEADRVCLPELALEAKAALPHAQVSAFAGAGHCPFWEQSERFNRELAAFAAKAQEGCA